MRNLPFDKPGRFYKGNLHVHSANSDGTLPPEELARVYREAGYDFLAITDHFLEEYGFPITDTRPARHRRCGTRPRRGSGRTGTSSRSVCPPTSPRRAPRRGGPTWRAGRWRPGRSWGSPTRRGTG